LLDPNIGECRGLHWPQRDLAEHELLHIYVRSTIDQRQVGLSGVVVVASVVVGALSFAGDPCRNYDRIDLRPDGSPCLHFQPINVETDIFD